jgi:hypothetical protein
MTVAEDTTQQSVSRENVSREGFETKYAARVATENCLNERVHVNPGVVDFVAARASENLTKLQRTTRRLQ